MFVIRNMATGRLVGEPSSGGGFRWHGIDAWCEAPPTKDTALKALVDGVR